MALLQNGFRDASAGIRIFGATVSNNAYPSALNSNTDKAGLKRNLSAGEGITSELASIPAGRNNKYTWVMPQKPGAISSRNEAQGAASWTGAIAAGRNIAGEFGGVAAFTATGQLVVSGSGSFAGVAAFSGNVTAALNAAGSFAGTASFSGAVVASGFMAGAFAGSASFSATRYATGSLSGSFAPPITLEASGFSTYLLDEEDVETGLTLRQALRLITAAVGGEVSGGGTTTITFRSAVADDADRIVATVDSNGNRTAITYDLQ